MPSYIELDKQASFPSASNTGKLILGVDNSNQLTLTNNAGVTNPVGTGTTGYTSYVGAVTQLTSSLISNRTIYNDTTTSVAWSVGTLGEGLVLNFSQSVNLSKVVPYTTNGINGDIAVEVDNRSSYVYLDTQTNNPVFQTAVFSGGGSAPVRTVVAVTDNKVLIGGRFVNYGSAPVKNLLRLNRDGSIDTTYNYNIGLDAYSGTDAQIRKIVPLSTGKVVLVGDFLEFYDATTDTNYTAKGIACLNSDGTFDTTFNIGGSGFTVSDESIAANSGPLGTPYYANVYSAVEQPDGKIIVCGWFKDYNGTGTAKGIIRLNANGTVDNTFDIGAGFTRAAANTNYDRVSAIALQSDGKVVCVGMFDTYNGVSSYSKLARLNSDGSPDATFIIGVGFNNSDYGTVVRITPNNKILIGGLLNTYNGNTDYINLIQLNLDGTVDTTYAGGSLNIDAQVNDVRLLETGKALVSGQFTTINGTNVYRLVQLNVDGTLNSKLGINGGFSDTVFGVEPAGYGLIYVYGIFTTYSDSPISNGLPRLQLMYNTHDVYFACKINGDAVVDKQYEIKIYN